MKKRILFVYYQNIKAGGVSKVLANLANALAEDGYSVEILFLMGEHPDFYPLDDRITKHYLDSFAHWCFKICRFNKQYFRFVPKLENINNYIYLFGVSRLLNRWVDQNHAKYDTIISCWYNLSCMLAINKKVSHKTIAWEHISHKTGGALWKRLRHFYKNLKGVVGTNTPGEKYYKSLNENATTIYNLMDDDLEEQVFIPAEEKSNIISMVARLDPEKNVGEFIKIISEINLPKDWKVIIIGSGSQETRLREEASHQNLSSKIEWMGSQNMTEVYQLLKKSKINCLTSKVEALPTILIQSMFFSNALIAYDCEYGPSDIITDSNGFLIPLGDRAKFIKKLELLIQDNLLLNELLQSSFEESRKWRKAALLEKWNSMLSQ